MNAVERTISAVEARGSRTTFGHSWSLEYRYFGRGVHPTMAIMSGRA